MKLPVKLPSKVPTVTAVKSTLQTAVTKPSLKTVAPVLAGLAMMTPVGAVVGVGAVLAVEHKDAIKTTLGSAVKTVKNEAKVVGSTVEKVAVTGAKTVAKGAKSVASGMQNFMYMAMGVGGLVVLMMVLKK